MKTLANPRDKAEIVRRLKLIGPALPHRWGNMSAHQMICHLSDVFRSSMGEREASRASRWIPRLPMRWTALWLPYPWPHGFPARPEWDQRIGGTAPTQFEADMAELHRLFERFTEHAGGFEGRERAVVGHISGRACHRLGCLPMARHLSPFGA